MKHVRIVLLRRKKINKFLILISFNKQELPNKRMKTLYIFLLVIFVTRGIDGESDEIAKLIKPSTDEKTQQQAALNVIRRLIHEKADNVAIKVNFKLPVNYFKVICISMGKIQCCYFGVVASFVT